MSVDTYVQSNSFRSNAISKAKFLYKDEVFKISDKIKKKKSNLASRK